MYVVGSVLLASYALLGGVSNVAVSAPLSNRAHTQLVKALNQHGMLGRIAKEKAPLVGAKLRAMAAQKSIARSSDEIKMPAVTEYDPPDKSDRIEMPAVDKDELKRQDLSSQEKQKLVGEGLKGMMSEDFLKKLEQLKKQQPTPRQ